MITIERGKTYLVTGGSGFLGKKTIERIHEQFILVILLIDLMLNKCVDLQTAFFI
jgi:nucleoside-diphosphate-sugar epimerase